MDRLRSCFSSAIFDEQHKTKVHAAQICLVVLMFILSGLRVANKPAGIPVTRSDTLGIVVGIKTIVVLLYQIVSTHVDRCRRWRSLKAYSILNSMEIVFWFVVTIVTLMGVSKLCQGMTCGMGWAIILVAVILMLFSFWTAVASIKCRRSYKRQDRFESELEWK